DESAGMKIFSRNKVLYQQEPQKERDDYNYDIGISQLTITSAETKLLLSAGILSQISTGNSENTVLNEINRISREYYYADHMNAILGMYTKLDEVTNLQCDYLETLEKYEFLEKELSKSKMMSNSPTSVSRPHLKSNQIKDRVMLNNSQGKKHDVEDHRRNVKFSKNKTFVTACNDSLNAKTSNVNFVCVTCRKCVLNDKHDMCVLHSLNGVNYKTKMPMAVPISTREPKRIVDQSVAKPLRRTVAFESTNQKPRHTIRKLYENVSKTCSWWYPKYTPPRYKWKPKSQIGNVNPNVSMPLGNASRTANILEPMTPRRSNV
nr:hypothetical protein [Tanacetum cinerariifolium]